MAEPDADVAIQWWAWVPEGMSAAVAVQPEQGVRQDLALVPPNPSASTSALARCDSI